MAEKKRRERAGNRERGKNKKRIKSSNSETLISENGRTKNTRRRTKGPRLPKKMREGLDLLNSNPSNSDEKEEIDSDEDEIHRGDLYEYEEGLPEEESKKNRRFDPVENFEYELPEQFEDENVPSDEEDEHDEEEDNGRHARLLHGITGMPKEAFEDNMRKSNFVMSEAYPESEYNPSSDVLAGDGRITIQDLLDPLHGKPGYSKLRKRMQHLEKNSIAVQAPLRKPEQEKVERKVVYGKTKKDITKWEPLVKRNREAPTIYFNEDVDLGFSTVGAIAAEFVPRTDFEKKMASLVQNDEVLEAHKNDGAKLLELNKVSVEDVKDRQNRLAKMRSLLFRHEMKAKHIKKIKSKTYHRLLKRDRMKSASTEMLTDPEAAKEQAMKQEFRRAEERMTLKHKNTSKWAKRILKRGLNAQDEGTRAAITEQLHEHARLTRKMNSMKDSSSSSDDTSDDDDDEIAVGSDQDGASKLLEKAKEKTLKAMDDDDDETLKSGVLSLPFMVRGLKKKKEAAYEEAKLALEEYETSLKQLDDTSEPDNTKIGTASGRRVFGAAKKQATQPAKKIKRDIDYGTSDSEDDFKALESNEVDFDEGNDLQKVVKLDPVALREVSDSRQAPGLENYDDIIGDTKPKTTYEVALFASGSWKKMMGKNEVDAETKASPKVAEPALQHQDQEVDYGSDTESEEEMVDGILSAGTKSTYELPSQADLIHQAFAGDDVEEEFEKDKEEILNEENPEPEKPVLLPGWGQWTHIQQKKGLPSWMLKEHESAKKKREEALKKRKDANLRNVIISERLDKKTEKLHTRTLPFPYTSQEVFEQSIRMPIGPEFNPATAVGALNRPEVVKKSGIIIKPIKFEEVNPHESAVENNQGQNKSTTKKNKGSGSKSSKKSQKYK
ncbi:hypothetical protein RJ641_030873 [Dillenia turbinata]|uniref:U3 small nucleolar RNA-associated protein 14 n=1 Tax=Dillenia turbinata TaxID=194707 RepID=A0AAN8ZKD9_9MAGN